MSTLSIRIIFVLFIGSMVAGCSLLSPVQLNTQKDVLSQMPANIPQRDIHVATLLVLTPETNPPYDTTRMAYRTHPFQIDYFSHHEWSATPSQMLLPLLVKTMENTRYFSEVLTPPYTNSYTYALRTEIIDLTQDFTAEPAVALVSLRFQLSDGTTGRVIATKDIVMRQRMAQKTPEAGVVAANNAIAKALQEMSGFVLEKVE